VVKGIYQPELQVKSLYCTRENRVLFSNLTFSLDSREWVQIQGRNGSGKSSLLKMLVGLLPKSVDLAQANPPQEILWQGRSIDFTDPSYLKKLIYIGHKSGIHLGLTVMENLEFYFKLRETESNKKNSKTAANSETTTETITSALQIFDLEKVANVVCEELSAGFRQRVALARLCFSTAKLWVLDEPCTALDQQGIIVFCQLLTQHLQKGGSAIIVSHTPLQTMDATLKQQILFLEENEPRKETGSGEKHKEWQID
jgi:heme exporter protein A